MRWTPVICLTPKDSDGENVCWSESPLCHWLSLLESPHKRSYFYYFSDRMMSECHQKELLFSEYHVKSDEPLSHSCPLGFTFMEKLFCWSESLPAISFHCENHLPKDYISTICNVQIMSE